MMGHTPTPWTTNGDCIFAKESEDLVVSEMANCDHDQDDANAIHIVKCVNAHDDLIEVLKLSTNILEAVHAAEPRDDAREMLGKLIMANRAVLEKTNA